MGLVSFLLSSNDEKLYKIRKFFRTEYRDYCNSASLGTKLRNEFFRLRHNALIVDGYLISHYSRGNKNRNWGDDLNIYLLELITNRKILPAGALFFPVLRKKICAIGSVIPQCVGENTIVWGSGVMFPNMKLRFKPKVIYAVRGPLTRNYLVKYNVECPQIFGDPALLLPLYYRPNIKRRYRLGVIPHHRDYDENQIKDILKDLHDNYDCIVIDVVNYVDWKEVVDEICSCECVISSSLHGLIVADTYNIPNIWAEFVYAHPDYYKYMDYFASVGRDELYPLQVYEALDKVNEVIDNYMELSIIKHLRDDLINSMPWEQDLK